MEVLFAGVRERQLAPAIDWYGRLFGRAPDIVPNDEEVMWRVTDGGWIYVLQDPARAGRSLVTIAVTDLEQETAGLAGRNIEFGPIEAIGDAARKATREDPDGNTISLIQVA